MFNVPLFRASVVAVLGRGIRPHAALLRDIQKIEQTAAQSWYDWIQYQSGYPAAFQSERYHSLEFSHRVRVIDPLSQVPGFVMIHHFIRGMERTNDHVHDMMQIVFLVALARSLGERL